MPNFPVSLDALANPTATTLRNDPGFELHQVISTLNDIAEALQAKVGTGASVPGASAAVLRRTASGASAWGPVAAGDLAAGAAGITKVAEMAADGTSPIMFVSGIPATYRRLTVQWIGRSTAGGSGGAAVGINFEASPSAGAYYHERLFAAGTGVTAQESLGALTYIQIGAAPTAGSMATLHASGTVDLPEYANGNSYKTVESRSASLTHNVSGQIITDHVAGAYVTTATISLVRIVMLSGNWTGTSRMTLYGWQA